MDRGDIADLKRVLNPRQFRQALFQATVRTTRKIAVLLKKPVQKHANIASKHLAVGNLDDRKRAIAVIRPKGNVPVGGVRISHRGLPLVAFPHVSMKRNWVRGAMGGVRVQTKKGGKWLTLKHAFSARMPKSGHKGIFLRRFLGGATVEDFQQYGRDTGSFIPRERAEGYVGKFGIFRSRGGAKLRPINARGYAKRLPIDEAYGPSVYHVARMPVVLNEITFDASAEYRRQIDSQINRFTGGRFKTLDTALADHV